MLTETRFIHESSNISKAMNLAQKECERWISFIQLSTTPNVDDRNGNAKVV